jgi:hypothetical protein
MHLLQAGVDITVIALWLGHESTQTTHGYLEADLALKEKALNKVASAGQQNDFGQMTIASVPKLALIMPSQPLLEPTPRARSPTLLGITINSTLGTLLLGAQNTLDARRRSRKIIIKLNPTQKAILSEPQSVENQIPISISNRGDEPC